MPPAVQVSSPTEATRLFSPVDIYVLRQSDNTSILDTVFVSRRSRRAAYATITHGTKTALWRVAYDGLMTEVAVIDWECEVHVQVAGDGLLRSSAAPTKKQAMVFHGGKMIRGEEFLRKGRGWFSSDSQLFTAEGKDYKWKAGVENSGPKEGLARNPNAMYHDIWKMWRCVTAHPQATPTSSRSPAPLHSPVDAASPNSFAGRRTPSPIPSRFSRSMESLELPEGPNGGNNSIRAIISPMLSAPAPSTLLARFAPPQLGLVYNEIALFPPAYMVADPGRPMAVIETMLVSAILLVGKKGDWRSYQSGSDAAALQATFVAEAAGEVPPYTPARRQAGRPRSRTHSGAVFRPSELQDEATEQSPREENTTEAAAASVLRQPTGARARSLFHIFTPVQTSNSTSTHSASPVTQIRSPEPPRPSSADGTRPSDGFYMQRRAPPVSRVTSIQFTSPSATVSLSTSAPHGSSPPTTHPQPPLSIERSQTPQLDEKSEFEDITLDPPPAYK